MTDREARRQAEQLRLDRLKTAKERNRLGQFATPATLSLDIAQYARRLWSSRTDRVRFFDPAIGTGSFYSALRQAFPPDIIAEAAGVEIDPAFAQAAEDLWAGTALCVVRGDFTQQQPDRRVNLILTNPPYVRHHHLSREDKERLKAVVLEHHHIDVSGLAGLYCYFLMIGDAWMEDRGLAAWLIPSEFMDVNYGVALKRYLTDRVKLLHIHRFSPWDVQFCDALVTSAIVVFEKTAPPTVHEVCMSFGGSISNPTKSELVPLPILRDAKKWTAFPHNGAIGKLRSATLGDYFTIKRGLATGANSFFILEREEAIRRGIPGRFLKPILPSSRYIHGSVIEADNDGYPNLDERLVVLDCDLSEETIRKRYPGFWAYLEEGKRRGIHQGYLASRRTPWYSQESRKPAPFLCTYMGRQGKKGSPFRFFLNRSQATAANVYLLLYPKGALKAALDMRPELFPVILSILQGLKADHLIGAGRVYGGGLHKMEPKEFAGLPAETIVEAIGRPLAALQMKLAFESARGATAIDVPRKTERH
jgi:methylase of polypeptide subunit release factors